MMHDSSEIVAARQRIVSALTEARLEFGISQQELANRIGTQKPNISRIESGQQNISLDTMLKIPYETVCREVMGPLQRNQLHRLINFRFTRHPTLNLPESRLQAIENHLRKRVRELLALPRKNV